MQSRLYRLEPDTRYDELFLSYKTNYKQALKTCVDLLSKFSSDHDLIYWKIRLWRQTGNLTEASELIQQLVGKKVKITDPYLMSCLTLLYKHILSDLNPGTPILAPPRVILDLWDLALSPGSEISHFDQQLILSGIVCGWWGLTLKGLFRLRKRHPDEGKYFYGHIAYTNLEIQQLKDETDNLPAAKVKELTVSEKLAFTFLNSAFTKTIQKQPAPILIKDSRDVRVLIQTFKRSPDHALKFVSEMTDESSVLYIFSSILGGNLEFLSDGLEIWKSNSYFQQIWDFCTEKQDGAHRIKSELLTRYRHDSAILDFIMAAAVGIGSEQAKADFESLLSGLLHEAPPSREAMHLAFRWYSSVDENNTRLLQSCIRFVNDNSVQESCFNDVKQYVEKFTSTEREVFMHGISGLNTDLKDGSDKKASRDWIYRKMSYLGFSYLNLALDSSWEAHADLLSSLNTMVISALEIVGLTSKLKVQGPAATVVLVSSLLWRLHQLSNAVNEDTKVEGKTTREIFQLLALNSFVISASDYNSEANRISTYINILCGLGSSAITNFNTLAVKNVLNDSMAHFLFTRLSATHPFAANVPSDGPARTQSWDPLDGYQRSIIFESRTMDRIDTSLGEDMGKFYPDKVEELCEFKTKLSTDIHYMIRLLEQRRIVRLRGLNRSANPFAAHQLTRYLTEECYSFDNRDWNTLPNFEVSTLPSFEQSIRPSQVPGKTWVQRMSRIELISDLLWETKPLFFTRLHLHNLQKFSYWVLDSRSNPGSRPRLDQPEDLWFKDMEGCNETEKIFHRAWGLIEPFTVYLSLPADTEYPVKPKDLSTLLKSLKRFIDGEIKRFSNPSFPRASTSSIPSIIFNIPTQDLFLNHAFHLLEFFQAVTKMVTLASTAIKSNSKPPHPLRGAISPDELVAVSKSTVTAVTTVQAYAQEWAKSLKSALSSLSLTDIKAVISNEGQDPVGESIIRHFGETKLHSFFTSVLESAVDALTGVTKIQIKK